MFWKPMKNNLPIFEIFSFWDMVDFVPKILIKLTKINYKNGQIFLSQKMRNVKDL